MPVENLIVVDGFSTDATMEIVNRINQKHGNITVLKLNGSRAKARQAGISRVTTEWFMFVDSDVILSKDWFKKAEKHVENDVGAVWGVNVDVIPKMRNKRYPEIQNLIARQSFNLRGGIHDTLIRREAVKDIRIPEELHTYEDAFITNWIKENGYKTIIDERHLLLAF